MVKLEIGCGNSPQLGYLHTDIRWGLPHVDVVCRGDKLPFKDCSISKIYASGVFEHFGYKEAQDAMFDWHRVLIPGGEIDFNVPDLYRWAKYLVEATENASGKTQEGNYNNMRICMTIFGWQTHKDDYHRSGWTESMITHGVESFGFENVEVYQRWAYSGIADAHLCLRANKPNR